MSISGRVALITGSGHGIGRGIAYRLAQEGARVVINWSRDQSAAEHTVDYITNMGAQAIAVRADVGEIKECEELVARSEKAFGPVEILICNAGIGQSNSVIDTSDAEWEQVINVNLSGEYFCARAVAKQMIDRKQGRIINISSSAFRHGGISGGGGVSYTSSKAGVIGLTRSLAKALGPYNITVNAIAPGPTLTPMTESWLPQKKAKLIEGIPLGRIGSPSDVANAALFLASDEASFITGTCLDVNGGLTMS